MAPKSEQAGQAIIRPRARLIRLIGKDLISDEPVAVVELVKNAYDADATKVTVKFNSAEPTELVIEDNGHGMDLDTVLDSWLEPGTNTKNKTGHSPQGRIYQGSKGIGRFASARLAETLLLETRATPNEPAVNLLFDWDKVDDNSYLDDVEVYWQFSKSSDLIHGTRLTLDRLREIWTTEDFEALHSRLSRLISPFNDVANFKIELKIPSHTEFSGDVEPPELITQPPYKLEGKLNEEGYFTGNIFHNGDIVKPFDAIKIGNASEKPMCGPFAVEIRVWDRDRDGLGEIAKNMDLKINDIRSTLNTYSGVSIYRDGFRVYPYGQPGNDWLKLGNRSRLNPVMRLGNNQIVAAIQISRQNNPKLNDRSNREGMILNKEHESLEKYFIEILSHLEAYRYDYRPRRSASQQATASFFEEFDIAETVKETQAQLGKHHPITELVEETEKQIQTGVDRVQETFSRLLLSAGLGQMVDLVIHEIGTPLGKINLQLSRLENAIKEFEHLKIVEEVPPMLNSIKEWTTQIHSLRQRLDPQTAGRRGRASRFDVKEEIDDTFNLYESLLKSQSISYVVRAPEEPVKVQMARAALGQILANLVNNSIYWLNQPDGDRQILVQLKTSKSGFKIIISDSGPGVAPEDITKIFEPNFTRKPYGMGLGLYIARLVIEPYGKLVYRDDCKLSGACFEATFERSVGL